VKYVTGEWCRDRERFADRLYCSEDTFAVADGMGIGVGGRMAAEKAVELIDEYRPFATIQELSLFFKEANLKIMEEIAKLGDREVAGTTLSLVSFIDGEYLLGHVGDSRIYLLRKGKLLLLTEDQITYRNGKKYVSALGIDWKVDVFLSQGTVMKGDIFLLMSDGAVNVLGEEEILSVLGEDIELSAQRLLKVYVDKDPSEDLSFAIVMPD